MKLKQKSRNLLLALILLLAVGGALVMLNTIPGENEDQKSATIKEDGFLLLEEDQEEITKTEAYDNAIQDSYNSDEINLELDSMFDEFDEKKEEEQKDTVTEEIVPVFEEETIVAPVAESKPDPVRTYQPEPKVVKQPTPVKTTAVPTEKKQVALRNTRRERESFYGSKTITISKPEEFRDDYKVEEKRLHCAVFNDQTITNGSRVTFRALEAFEFRGETFPKNTLLYGTADFKNNRILVDITQASISQKVIAVSMNLYDQDGGQGIYSSELSQVSKATERKGQSTASKLVNGLAGSLSGGYVNGVGDIITSSGDGNKKVELYDGYDVYAVF